MPKLLLLRTSDDLRERLSKALAQAGFDVAAPEDASVETVLQQEPDLLLLQTDVATLDCCGLISAGGEEDRARALGDTRFTAATAPCTKKSIQSWTLS
jgi:DNA-binding response OmpR family regulator